MSFNAVIPSTGYIGWTFLSKTLEQQKKTFSQNAEIRRDTAYLSENIGKIKTTDDLIKNYKILKVTLSAFGLESDIQSKAFIKKLVDSDLSDPKSFANKLSASKYKNFASTIQSILKGSTQSQEDKINSLYIDKKFEVNVGEQDNNLRLALNLSSAIKNITETTSSNNAQWYSMMGDTPTRTVIEKALGIHSSTSRLPVEKQLIIFKNKFEKIFKTQNFSETSNVHVQEKIIRLFLIKAELGTTQNSTLQIIQNIF